MAHFNLNQRDLSTIAADFAANAQNITPSGAPLPLRTTGAENPTTSLTSYSVSEIMQGSATYKPRGLIDDAFNQTLSSDLGGLLKSEGGPNQILGGRQGLLPADVLARQGFQDGIFQDASGMSGLGGNQGPDVAGNTPPSDGTVPTQRPPSSGAVEDLLRWCEEHSGPNGTSIPYSQEQGTAPTHANGGQTSGRYGMNVVDCTGFCTSAYFFGMGIEINNNAQNAGFTGNMYNSPLLLSVEVPASDRQPGDLMIVHVSGTTGHGAIYYGDNQIVGTSSDNGGTWITNEWMTNYYAGSKVFYFRVANLG